MAASGTEVSACVLPPGALAQRRISRMVPSSAAAKTAKGAIQATRSKPWVVGAASTVARTWRRTRPESPCRSCRRRWPRSARRAPRPLSGQPTWLHSPSNCAQPQVHISRWSRSLKRELASVAPSEKQTATASTAACNDFIQKDKRVKLLRYLVAGPGPWFPTLSPEKRRKDGARAPLSSKSK